jgi:purine-binding chemotaxis protein CheW
MMQAIGHLSKMSLAPYPGAVSRNFLVFRLGRYEYGVEAGLVEKLRVYGSLTPVRSGADLVEGVVKVDGVIMPIVDLRVPVSKAMPRYDKLTIVMILTLFDRSTAVAVDAASEVIALRPDQIDLAPESGGMAYQGCVIGSTYSDERRVILLDLELLLSAPSELMEKRAA